MTIPMTNSYRTEDGQASAPPSRKKPWWRSRASMVIGLVLAAFVFVWLGRGVAKNWGMVSSNLSHASPWMVAAVVVLQLCFMLCIGLCYYNALRLAGAAVRVPAAIGVYLASQLGKYVPGKVLYVAGQIGLATWLRISPTQSILGFTAHHLFLVAMGFAAAGPLLGMLVEQKLLVLTIILVTIGVVILVGGLWVKPFNMFQRKRQKPELETFSPGRAFAGMLSACCGWIAYAGIAIVFTWMLHPGNSTAVSIRVGMAAVAGWLVGFLSFLSPVGVGVREGVFVLLTRSIIPEPTAMAVALMMRVLITVFQVPLGGLALTYSIRARPNNAAGGSR
jgi:uncharacterized membrane protein YbhN (UPF0104 family)